MKIGLKLTILFTTILLCMNSCVTSKDTNLLQDIKRDYPQVDPNHYRIIPGDQLVVFVYSIDEETKQLFDAYQSFMVLDNRYSDGAYGYDTGVETRDKLGLQNTKPFSVYADGTIKFPYVGKIYVEGFTLLEARKILSEKLNEFSDGTTAEVYLKNLYFSVIGESGAARIDMPSTQTSIYQALALANAITRDSDLKKVSIIRQTKDGSTIKTFDLRSKDIVDSDFYYIQANDVIYFPQSSSKLFGGTSSFVGVFSLLVSVAGIVILVLRLI